MKNKRDSNPPNAPFCCVYCTRVPDYANFDKIITFFQFEGIPWGPAAEGLRFSTKLGFDAPLIEVGHYSDNSCVRCNRRIVFEELSFGLHEPYVSRPTIFWCEHCIKCKLAATQS